MSRRLIRSGLTVSSMTLLSRLLGLLRDMVIANVVGAGPSADLFLFANRIPNFLRRLFAEGAFSQAFVPILTEYQQREDPQIIRQFIQRVAGTLGGVITLVTLGLMLLSPLITSLFAFGWFVEWWRDGAQATYYPLASQLLRITFPYLGFITLVAFSGAVLNSLGRFSIAAFSPVLLNLAIIGCALWLTPYFTEPAFALAIGVFLGGLLQLLFQLPFLRRVGLLVWPRWDWQDIGVRRIRQLMLPALLGVSVNQITLLVNTAIASFLQVGAISWLYYADRLVELPLGLIGATLVTILLPTLARLQAQTNPKQFRATIDWGLKMVVLLGIPAVIGLLLLAEPIILLIYRHGKFTLTDLEATTAALYALATGIFPLLAAKVFSCGYYARQDIRTPVRYALWTMSSHLLFNILAWPFGYVGLALASALSGAVNATLLYHGLARHKIYCVTQTTAQILLRLLLASAGMASALYLLTPERSCWLAMPFIQRLGWLAALIAGASLLYGLLLSLLGIRKRQLSIAWSE
ncbi:MAG: murein biosynthesis integral membrane protein MurJ [Candidatus Symbiodolus clandestinus]